MSKHIWTAILLTVFLVTGTAMAQTPLEAVRDYMEDVQGIIEDPTLQDRAGREIIGHKLNAIANDSFDFYGISRITLGRHWGDFSREQQREFLAIYAGMLKTYCLDKARRYSDREVTYVSQKELASNRAEVKTTIRVAWQDVPVYYRLINREGKWRIYDIKALGISIIQNYRKQFESILRTSEPATMIAILKDKYTVSRDVAGMASHP